jgi:uncharacterized membrane protein
MEVRPMRAKLVVLNLIPIFLISIAFIFISCKKEQEVKPQQSQEMTEAETPSVEKLEKDVQEVMKPADEKGTELKKEMDDLLSTIKDYEQTLIAKQQQLNQQADSIKVKKEELAKMQGSLKSYRTASWIIFLVGLVLFVIGLIFLLVARSKTAPQRAEKQQKKLTKSAEKEEKKTEKNMKKDTPPKK